MSGSRIKSGMTTHGSQAGFGLLEVLISASILALIAGATIGLASNAVNTAVLGANRTTASQLSQEGVELVRQMRDTTYLDGQPNRWNQQPGVASTDLPDCTTGCALALAANGNWTLDGTKPSESIALVAGTGITTFTRSIALKPIPWYGCPDAATTCSTNSVPTIPNSSTALATSQTALIYQVKSTVGWVQNGRKIEVTSSTFLSDWRPVQ